MAAKSTKLCDTQDGKRQIRLTDNDRVRIGRKEMTAAEAAALPKGDLRRLRKALRDAGRFDLIRETMRCRRQLDGPGTLRDLRRLRKALRDAGRFDLIRETMRCTE